jgi:electron transport complex protein RnfG
MKDTLRLIVVLTLICLLAGLMLAWVNKFTAEPIKQAELAEKMNALREVLPEYDNAPNNDTCVIESDGKEWIFYVARKGGSFVGAAFETVSSEGYGGDITIMVGVTADKSLCAIDVLKAKETPGLGAKIDAPEFKEQFNGKGIEATKWAVTKDQGDIHAVTAATISSRAVVAAVSQGLDVLKKNLDTISKAGS